MEVRLFAYEDALKEIIDCSGSQFNPEVAYAFQGAYEKNKEKWPLTGSESIANTMQEALLGQI